MESAFKIIILSLIFFICKSSYSQNERAFCKAVEKSNFSKVERIVHKVIKKNRKGQKYYNGPGSGWQIDLSPGIDSITGWLKHQSCVEDAFWDKCQMKIAIYPGWSSVGGRFITKKGIVEKCFKIQEGTTGQINIFGWQPKIFKSKMKLVYKKMYDCDGFIDEQKKNCKTAGL